jgi:colanic acid/amylovoran biosynthesis glycosyltransferase
MGAEAKTIGLVLAQTPAYTETFLVNKIKGLMENGFSVLVFTGKRSDRKFSLCQEVTAYSIPTIFWLKPAKIMAVLLLTVVRCPVRTWNFVKQEYSIGSRLIDTIQHLFISAHILPYRLHNLHFGFATLGVGRESLGKAMKVTLSTSFRGFDVSIYPLRNPTVYARLWNVLDKVHTISDDLYETALSLGLNSTVPVHKITPAIEVREFLYPNRVIKQNGPIRILTVARLQWKKGLEVALDAMAILKERGISFRYTIIGKGVEWERLEFARHQLNLTHEVEFAGALPHDQVKQLMCEHDFYIQPSLQEGFCNAVIEAQASGMLCIVSNAEGLDENVLHEQTGWVVPKWDARALAYKIVDVNALPLSKKEKITQVATTRALTQFSLPVQKNAFRIFFS